MRFACLYMPEFLLQANLRHEPGAMGQPYALVEGAYPRVVAATRKALEAGVTLGMTGSQAAQFAAIRRRSKAQEDSAQAALLDCARSSSPRVEDTAAGAVVVDLEGLERVLPSTIAADAASRAKEIGARIRVAFASNPDTAILAARGFRGVTVIPCGEEARKLAELPVSLLNAPPEALAAFERWGVRRLKDLAQLPPLPLSERLGQEGVRLQQLARGEHFRPLIASLEAGQFEESWELEEPARTLDELDFVLASLLTRLSKRLSMRSLAAQEMRLRLELAQGIEPEPSLALEELQRETRSKPQAAPTGASPASGSSSPHYERTLSFPSPINNARLFFKLWRLRLESDLPRQPVMKAEIAAAPARPRAVQSGLFTPLEPDPEKLELVLARIAAVVGSGNVGSPEPADTHQPHVFRMAQFTEAHARLPARKPERPPAPQPGAAPPVMALRLFRPPRPARVELSSGIPACIAASRFHGRIISASGPWRRSGGWWEDDKWDREEWDVEVRAGKSTALYLLCYDLLQDAWTVQGEYD